MKAIYNPFHSSQYVPVKRQSRCKGCSTYDDVTIWKDGVIEKGSIAIEVKSGSGPSTRTERYHPECYFNERNRVMSAFLDSSWKVQESMNERISVIEGPSDSDESIDWTAYCADDLPF